MKSKKQIFSDFSDTIAIPTIGYSFLPFEIELAKMIAKEISGRAVREKFEKESKNGYEEFTKIRREESIPYKKRALTWLKPFTGKLKNKHFDRLVRGFRVNKDFFELVKILKIELDLQIVRITIVSGTLTQIITSFLNRKDIQRKMKREKIKFEIEATELIMNKKEIFTGEIKPTHELVYKGNFPEECLIIGDDKMEKYGFGRKLLNAQSFNAEDTKKRIRESIDLTS